MGNASRVPITPEVLRWAIDTSGFSPEEVAIELELHKTSVQHWLRGFERPTLTQFRRLAQLLKRPTATFFLPAPPAQALGPVQFRPAPGDRSRPLLPAEQFRIREAERLQRGVAWIMSELGRPHVVLPRLRGGDVERAARQARELLKVPVSAQLEARSDSAAQAEWRGALERLGVMVLYLPMGANAARGFSLWHERAPLVAVNTHWSAAARSFTMLHELGHLLTRTSSICAEFGRRRQPLPSEDIERWCEKFAGAVLLPAETVNEGLSALNLAPTESIRDLALASKLARQFKVSLRATVLRLISLDRASSVLYSSIPRATDAKKGGRGGVGRSRTQIKIDEYGGLVARTFASALKREAVDASEVARYLDVPFSAAEQLEALAG